MPLITPVPDSPAPKPSNPNIKQEDKNRNIAVDTEYVPRASLITHIEGSKWIVNYYSQYLTGDMEVAAQEVNRDPVYQQYLKIENLEIRVQQPLEPQSESNSDELTLTGTALLYPGLLSNKGDMFTALLGDGRVGLFTVEEVRQRTHLLDTAYEITYTLKDYLDAWQEDLESKVVKTQIFVKDFYGLNKTPFLIRSEYEQLQSLLEARKDLLRYFYHTFFNVEYSTFMQPTVDNITHYDPHFVKFITWAMSPDELSELNNFIVYNTDDGRIENAQTILTALSNRDNTDLNFISFKSEVKPVKILNGHPRLATIIYSKINNLYIAAEDEQASLILPPQGPAREFRRPVDVAQLEADALEGLNIAEIDVSEMMAIKDVFADDYYIFSEAFYLDTPDQLSIMEILVKRYLSKSSIPIDVLLAMTQLAPYWQRTNQFYYMPILAMLCEAAINDIN